MDAQFLKMVLEAEGYSKDGPRFCSHNQTNFAPADEAAKFVFLFGPHFGLHFKRRDVIMEITGDAFSGKAMLRF